MSERVNHDSCEHSVQERHCFLEHPLLLPLLATADVILNSEIVIVIHEQCYLQIHGV